MINWQCIDANIIEEIAKIITESTMKVLKRENVSALVRLKVIEANSVAIEELLEEKQGEE